MEPDGLAGDSRCELACDPDRELDPLCIAALFAGGAGTLAGAQTRDRILWRTCGDEGDARRGTVGALRSWHCADGPECHNGNAARRPCGRSGARGTRPLHSSNGALEIRRLGGFRHGARGRARVFGRYKPAIGWPLGVEVPICPLRLLDFIIPPAASLWHETSAQTPRFALRRTDCVIRLAAGSQLLAPTHRPPTRRVGTWHNARLVLARTNSDDIRKPRIVAGNAKGPSRMTGLLSNPLPSLQ